MQIIQNRLCSSPPASDTCRHQPVPDMLRHLDTKKPPFLVESLNLSTKCLLPIRPHPWGHTEVPLVPGAVPDLPDAGWRADPHNSGHKISAVFWETEQSPYCVIYVIYEVVARLFLSPCCLACRHLYEQPLLMTDITQNSTENCTWKIYLALRCSSDLPGSSSCSETPPPPTLGRAASS